MSLDLEDVPAGYRDAVAATLRRAGIDEGHLAVELVDAARIHELNLAWRGIDRPTDVLSFPVDESGPAAGPRELGDVVVCPEYCRDFSLTEAVVHGVLHLCGHDHETDDGEMLDLQARIMEEIGETDG